jgi:hypothetical protein
MPAFSFLSAGAASLAPMTTLGEPMTVLVVDDDPALQLDGYRVETAPDGVTRAATLACLPRPTASTGGGAVTFPVTLTMQGPPPGLLPGMSAQVTITTAQRTNAQRVLHVADGMIEAAG